MGQINVTVGGRSYPLACRDGEEERLHRIAAGVDAKARELTGALGQMSEPRLLLMTAILLGDELAELRESPAPATSMNGFSAGGLVADRLEAVAAHLEQAADRA